MYLAWPVRSSASSVYAVSSVSAYSTGVGYGTIKLVFLRDVGLSLLGGLVVSR